MKQRKTRLLLTVLSLSLAAGTNPAFAIAQTDANARVEEVMERELDVYVDCSRSLDHKTLKAAVDRLLDHLPHIVEKWDVTKLRTYCFGQDGWTAEEMLSRDLPKRILPYPQQSVNAYQDNEVTAILINFAKAKKQKIRDKIAEKEDAVQKEYHDKVEQQVRTIDHAAFLPPADFPKSSCTDLNGVLHRISAKNGLMPAFVAMITDGAESCSPALESVPPPKTDLSLVFILVPEKSSGAKKKQGQHLRGQQQFEIRKEQISSAIPWAHVVPFFHKDLSQAFAEAQKKPRTRMPE